MRIATKRLSIKTARGDAPAAETGSASNSWIKLEQTLLVILFTLGTLLLAGCQANNATEVPSDFLFIMDVKSAGGFEGCAVNVNLRIEASGRGRYETYDTDCAIEFDTSHMVTYDRSRVITKGQFKLRDSELEQLWAAIDENNFFSLTEDYRMAMGFSYAFIVVEADGQRNIVDNIGMEVPEARAIVEATDAIMSKEINLDYGEGFIP